jgi:hypothetical protein
MEFRIITKLCVLVLEVLEVQVLWKSREVPQWEVQEVLEVQSWKSWKSSVITASIVTNR